MAFSLLGHHDVVERGVEMTEQNTPTADDDDPITVESRHAPPTVHCPNCDSMMPHKLGEISCAICSSVVRVDHKPTRRDWVTEKVSCPSCSEILIAGIDERPCGLKCSSCSTIFKLVSKEVKVEVSCPSCKRTLRLKPRPGSRNLTCPACDETFLVTF